LVLQSFINERSVDITGNSI